MSWLRRLLAFFGGAIRFPGFGTLALGAYAFIPDTDARLQFWRERGLPVIAPYLASPWTGIVLVAVGLCWLWYFRGVVHVHHGKLTAETKPEASLAMAVTQAAQPSKASVPKSGDNDITLFDPPSAAQRNSDGTARLFVSAAPDILMKEFSRLTSDQAKTVVGGYLGKWMALEGPVYDVTYRAGGALVTLGGPSALAIISYGAVQLNFLLMWNEKIKALLKGEKIRVVCRIDDITGIGMAFGRCELL